MTRRFPPGAVSLPTHPVQYKRVLQLVDRGVLLTWREFQQAFQGFIRDPDTEKTNQGKYSDSSAKRTVSDLETAAVVRKQVVNDLPTGIQSSFSDNINVATLWPCGRAYLDGEIPFEDFIWRSVKRGWVLLGNAPEKIEGLERVLKVLLDSSEPLQKGEIENQLTEQHKYEFSTGGIRGYPNLLLLMGAITRTGKGYAVTPTAETYLQRFREAELFRAFERWIQREGPTGQLPREDTKRDMAKYYMYRESDGWGKQLGWLKAFWSEYLDHSARKGKTKRPSLKRAEAYVDADNERASLRDQIRHEHGIETGQLRGVPTSILRRMAGAETSNEAERIRASSGSGVSRSDLELLTPNREDYKFHPGFELYDWQEEAVDEWFGTETSESQTGIAQVVTGAGKTVMALDIVRRWLRANPKGVVTIIVPTKVLMQQWLTELVEKLNVPVDEIGWAGDGNRDSFADDRRVVVSIVNTAVKNNYLSDILSDVNNPPHLLIADECHRYTGEVFSNVFSYHRTASLGLSATPTSTIVSNTGDPDSKRTTAVPETDTNEENNAELTTGDQLLLEELGEIYYSLTYDQAHNQGLIPPFEVNYVRFDLTQTERNQYEVFSRKVSNAISDIEARHGNRIYQLNGNFAQKLNTIRNSTDGPTPSIGDFFEFTQKRRELVANAVTRQAITLDLLQGALKENKKSIVFQEQIEQLEQLIAPHESRGRNPRTGEVSGEYATQQELYEQYPSLEDVDRNVEKLFRSPKFKPVMYHSGHSRRYWNDFAMEWFRDDGFANTMFSVKALIEGVDVPSADLGIIRVSSSSLRQRIQTLGRILRTGGDATKRSQLFVLYARDTVDEKLFKEYDWSEQLANAEINHFEWKTAENSLLEGEIEPIDEPLPTGPKDWEKPSIPSVDKLKRGDHYEGPRRGFEFSVDSEGRPFRKDGNRRKFITNTDLKEVATYVRQIKGGGSVTVNEANHMLTQTSDGPVFLGVAPDLRDFSYEDSSGGLTSSDAPDSLDFM